MFIICFPWTSKVQYWALLFYWIMIFSFIVKSWLYVELETVGTCMLNENVIPGLFFMCSMTSITQTILNARKIMPTSAKRTLNISTMFQKLLKNAIFCLQMLISIRIEMQFMKTMIATSLTNENKPDEPKYLKKNVL